MRVLLTTINSKYIHQNLAIRMLYALNKDYPGLEWKEFAGKEDLKVIIDYCSNFQLIAFSCYIWNIQKTIEVAHKLKEIKPEIEILLGGPEVSYEWHDIISLNAVDYLITGEGEIPFTSFLSSFPYLENIPALIWKKNGDIIENRTGKLFDLQQLESINPYIYDNHDDLVNKIAYVEASRGCPYTCEFCLAGLDNKLRYLPMQTIQNSLLFLMQHGRIIKFLDRTFNARPKFAIEIFSFIVANHQPKNIFQFEIKADVPQLELVEFVKNNVPKGLFRFEIGIQTLNKKSNDAVKRRQDFDNIKMFINEVAEKVDIHLDLLIGLPHDYWEDIKYSFEEVFQLFQPELQFGFLKFLKGTPVRSNLKEHGYRFQQQPPYQILSSNYLSENELTKLNLLEHALEIYWNKKRAVNTLKYITCNYSIFDFLLNLGNYFKMKTSFHRYDIKDVFGNLYDFVCEYFSENIIVRELVAIDYYMHYKVKPKAFFLRKPEKEIRKKIVLDYGLNVHKYRYIIHPVHFKLKKYFTENKIETINDFLIIQYDGENKPILIL